MPRGPNLASRPVASRPGPHRLGLALAAGLLVGSPAAVAASAGKGVTHALLINGGSKPTSNYQSHLHHLQEMVALLERRGIPAERIHVFSSDGTDSGRDLAVRDTLPSAFWLIEGTATGRALRPRTETIDTRWWGVALKPARKKELEAWFKEARRKLEPGDRLLVFVTDHGTENKADPDDGAISLWHEKLTVREFDDLLARLRPGVQVVMLMSQCYSGTFAKAMDDRGSAEPSGRVCGFFSTARDLPAYGCYPEGRDRDRIGHAFAFIDALGRHATTDAAHLEVLAHDHTPDVPLRTSDLYLQRAVEREAKVRGMAFDALVDELLAAAWGDRAAWEPEIRLLDRLGSTYGLFSPRSLAELAEYDGALPDLVARAKEYAERWEAALGGVAQEALGGFVDAKPEWKGRLDTASLGKLDAAERQATLGALLPALESHARGRAELWTRLEGIHERARRASEAEWRLEIRRAAVRRMRALLVGIAGRELLAAGGGDADGATRPRRGALERLERCEAFEPGVLPAPSSRHEAPEADRLPPLAEEMRLLDEVLPAWLGVRFGPTPKALSEGRDLEPGATWLQAIYPDSPASEAGLEEGDIVLGPPDRPFTALGQLREWTMTSTPGSTRRLVALRPGKRPAEDRRFEVEVRLKPLPLEWPKLPAPPEAGDPAPQLPDALEPVGEHAVPDLRGKAHLLFFWATWCEPCKRSVPEVRAFAAERGLSVLAISDEEPATVASFLEGRTEPFFEHVVVDVLRRSFRSYGVSGTPTIVWVGADGVVRGRQVGYTPAVGLRLDGGNASGR